MFNHRVVLYQSIIGHRNQIYLLPHEAQVQSPISIHFYTSNRAISANNITSKIIYYFEDYSLNDFI